MPVADLLRDPRLVAPSLEGEPRTLTVDFIGRRVRRLVELNPANADPARRGDITPAATVAIANIIAGELPRVAAAAEAIAARVATDAAHLKLDPATVRRRGTKRPPLALKDARANRRRLVRSIAYQAAAFDITLADPANVERLHRLCDRRLRIAERMLYDVGKAGRRAWDRTQIRANPGGPWLDGYERLFEYPRVPRSFFLDTCQPDVSSRCRAPMQAWGAPAGDPHLIGPLTANPRAGAAWRRSGEYELDFDAAAGVDAVTAVQRLFEPSRDYLGRNLMYCDHAIHVLHVEALVFAMTKRGAGSAWLAGAAAAGGSRWLRIHAQFSSTERFLGGSGEPRFFDFRTVRIADLEVGDHLIVYNHPAYAKATVGGVWRLENAIVVQTLPKLLLQGHGSALRDQRGMWKDMIAHFNGELDRRRADVAGLAHVRGFAANRVTVDSARLLTPRMRVDIVSDDVAETVLARGREITSVAGNVVGYDGASVSAATPHRLRRARSRAFNDAFEAIEGPTFRLVRRVPPALSQYDAANGRADWHLAWFGDDADEAIRTNSDRAAFVKAHHLIDYTREQDGTRTRTVGWFPLWGPSRDGGGPPRRGGRIVKTEPIVVKPRHVAGWTWFFDPNPAKRDLVPVIRPKEL